MATKESTVKEKVAVQKPRVFISVDSGKNTTKAVKILNSMVTKRFSVATKMNETSEKFSTQKSSHVVTLNGKSELIGGLKGKYNFDTSKAQEVHRRATYLSVSKLADPEDNVVLSIGCPLSVWFNTYVREAYKRFMLNIDDDNQLDVNEGNIPLEFIVDGEVQKFNIEAIIVYPETLGLSY